MKSRWPIVADVPGWPMCLARLWVPSDANTPMAIRVIRRNYGPDWLVTLTPPVIPQPEVRTDA
jgi:hypothetical protein